MYIAVEHRGTCVEDEAIFQVDARGPGGSEYCTVNWAGSAINAAILTWTAPNGHVMTPLVVLRCPCCDFPIAVRPDISAQCRVERGLLTLRQVVKCPGHWPQTDDFGNIVADPAGRPKRSTCPWTATIVHGIAHKPSCAAVSRESPTPCTCTWT